MHNLVLPAKIPALLVLAHALGTPHRYANFWARAISFVVRLLVTDDWIRSSGQVARPELVTMLRGHNDDRARTVMVRAHGRQPPRSSAWGVRTCGRM